MEKLIPDKKSTVKHELQHNGYKKWTSADDPENELKSISLNPAVKINHIN